MRTLPLLMLVACGVSDLAELDLEAAADPAWPLADGGQLPPPTLTLTVTPLREGEPLEIVVTGAGRGDLVRVGLTTAGAGAGPCPPSLGGECLGLVGPVRLVGQGRADAAGERAFAAVAPGQPTVDVCFQAAVVNAGALGDLSNVVCRTIQPALTAQPGPGESQDVWTTSVYSYTGAGGGPGGGLDNDELRIGGWGDTYHALVAFDLHGLPEVVSQATLELHVIQSASAPSFRVDVATSPWDWTSQGTGSDRERLWWADHPSHSAYGGPYAPSPVGAWDSVDITALYNAWQDGSVPNLGVVLRPDGTWNNWQYWASSETPLGNELRPRIVVVP